MTVVESRPAPDNENNGLPSSYERFIIKFDLKLIGKSCKWRTKAAAY
jgi:hypothetical protein